MSVMLDDPRAEQLVCCDGYCLAGQSPVHEPDCPNYPDAGICPWCERPLHRLGERCPMRQIREVADQT